MSPVHTADHTVKKLDVKFLVEIKEGASLLGDGGHDESWEKRRGRRLRREEEMR